MSQVHNLYLQLPKRECSFLSPQLPPCTTFTLFPYLPLELRNKVWGLAACVSQDIILTHEKNPPRSYHRPAIMHTSREARQEGSRYYTQCRDVAHIYTPPILNPYRTIREYLRCWSFLFYKLRAPATLDTPQDLLQLQRSATWADSGLRHCLQSHQQLWAQGDFLETV